jgi:hypothetical protein
MDVEMWISSLRCITDCNAVRFSVVSEGRPLHTAGLDRDSNSPAVEEDKSMKRILALTAVAALGLMALAAPAHAQASRTWVSGVGDDANPCSRTAPCKTFAGAISKTATGGYIDCLDPGGFGAVTITKSITIQCDEEIGHVLVSSTNGIVVSIPAGSQVTLRGLSLEGFSSGLNGISFIGQGSLTVQETVIHDFTQNGINFAPSGAGTAVLSVSDETLIFNNGNNNTQAGINIAPSGGAVAVANINGVQLTTNQNGIIANGAGGVAGLSVRDVHVARNANDGIQVTSAGGTAIGMIDHATLAQNGATGAHSNGAGATILIGNSTVFGNPTGVSITGGAAMQSFKNNQFGGNTSDGTPITAAPGANQ